MVKRRARKAMVSGELEPVVDSGYGGHSVFANPFLRTLRDNQDVIDGETLFSRVKLIVVNSAHQTPQFGPVFGTGHENGDFLFVRR